MMTLHQTRSNWFRPLLVYIDIDTYIYTYIYIYLYLYLSIYLHLYLSVHLSFKTNYNEEPYLMAIHNVEQRIQNTKFRISNHNLAIEEGRYGKEKVPIEFCNNSEIETEKYMLFKCAHYAEIRSEFLARLTTVKDIYGAPEGTRKLKSFEWLDCTNNKVLNVAIAQTIKFRMSPLHKQ